MVAAPITIEAAKAIFLRGKCIPAVGTAENAAKK